MTSTHSSFRRFLWLAAVVIAVVIAVLARSNAAFSQSTGPSVQIQTAAGQTVQGELLSIDSGSLELQSASEQITTSFEAIARVDFIQSAADQPLSQPAAAIIQLSDGSMLPVKSLENKGNEFRIQTVGGVEVQLAKNSVQRLLFFNPADDDGMRQKWDEFLSTFEAPSDAIVAQKNDNLQGIEGLVKDIADGIVSFTMGERNVEVKTEKLMGVLYYRASREFPSTVCLVSLTDGTVLSAQQVVFTDGVLNVVTRTGDRVVVAPAKALALDFSAGRAVYLSDLLPTTNDWKPLVASKFSMKNLSRLRTARINESFSRDPLELRSLPEDSLNFLATTETFMKGFAINGGGRLSFTLNGQFKRLTALAGFDPEVENLPGVVKLIFEVDGKTVVSQTLKNRELQKPFPIDIDIVGAQRLVIRVDYQDGRPIGDRIHIVNAQVSR